MGPSLPKLDQHGARAVHLGAGRPRNPKCTTGLSSGFLLESLERPFQLTAATKTEKDGILVKRVTRLHLAYEGECLADQGWEELIDFLKSMVERPLMQVNRVVLPFCPVLPV
jgi:hypothetical protein